MGETQLCIRKYHTATTKELMGERKRSWPKKLRDLAIPILSWPEQCSCPRQLLWGWNQLSLWFTKVASQYFTILKEGREKETNLGRQEPSSLHPPPKRMSRDLEHIILIPPTLTCLRQDLQACCDMKSVCVCGGGRRGVVCVSIQKHWCVWASTVHNREGMPQFYLHHECGCSTKERLIHANVVDYTEGWKPVCSWDKAACAVVARKKSIPHSQNHKANLCSARLLLFILWSTKE